MGLESTSAVFISCATAGRQSPLPLPYQQNYSGQEETQGSFVFAISFFFFFEQGSVSKLTIENNFH